MDELERQELWVCEQGRSMRMGCTMMERRCEWCARIVGDGLRQRWSRGILQERSEWPSMGMR